MSSCSNWDETIKSLLLFLPAELLHHGPYELFLLIISEYHNNPRLIPGCIGCMKIIRTEMHYLRINNKLKMQYQNLWKKYFGTHFIFHYSYNFKKAVVTYPSIGNSKPSIGIVFVGDKDPSIQHLNNESPILL